ncbi:hypothetical protein Acsp03_13440 [Actinomadura sp. NBRC 104412]|uniref:hypothetical protein n=1 Tax=Actinomadura sp. NBRC 104412 TaxID=3032203 RepID=UPI00249F96FD|nr:hypothetical protein [Actinomadura sp. NBRC 104412]GLZ03878.1 hypothetical protein Acsp03_13440 [Actinomadura sp. NBRC 104412]
MPRGTYRHLEPDLEERFQCAPGAGGWRYVGERSDGVRVDLVVDARWRQMRVELAGPDWWIRGGVSGHDLIWVRGGGPEATERSVRALGFLGESPGFLVAVSRSLRLEPGGHADIRLVQITGTALSALTVDRRWRLAEVTTYETETEPLPVARYEVADLATGEVQVFHLAGDVVLDAPGIELADLETPPSLASLP